MAKALETKETNEQHQQRLFTVDEYDRMAEMGIFKPDERVELIHGVVRPMSPKGQDHTIALAKIIKRLFLALSDQASVYPEPSLRLVRLDSVPEPDVVVTSSPVPEDLPRVAPALVIEVSVSSLRYDLTTKAQIYAEADVPEYWVVNLVERELVVFRSPTEGAYRERTTYRPNERVSPLSWPDVEIDVAELFPNETAS